MNAHPDSIKPEKAPNPGPVHGLNANGSHGAAESIDDVLHKVDFHHILLWMPNWIGDVVMVMPTIQSLRERYPKTRITAVVRGPADEILQGHPAVDSVIKIPLARDNGAWGQIRFAWKLRKYSFDLGVVFPNSFRSAFLLFLTGAKFRVGYDTEGRSLFFTHSMPRTQAAKKEYRVDYFFNLLASLGLPKLTGRFQNIVQKGAERTLEARLEELGGRGSGFLVSVHCGTSKPQRSWHADRFGILCQSLIKQFNMKIILLGMQRDLPSLKVIRNNCPPDRVHLMVDLNLQETAAMIKKSDLFIGNDSGLMHIAAMVGTPLVAIFGPGSPDTTGPFIDPKKQAIVTKNYSCSPCRQRFFKDCEPSSQNKPYCLEDISVNEVAGAARNMLMKSYRG